MRHWRNVCFCDLHMNQLMKKTLLACVTLIFSCGLLAQDVSRYPNATFSSLSDLMDHKPSDILSSEFHCERHKYKTKINGNKVTAYRVKGPKRSKLPKGKVFAILVDGQLFINPDCPRLTRRADFYQVDWIQTHGYFINLDEYRAWIHDVFMT